MTTDNPRELRISAQRCLECDEPLRRRIDALADYILATVRDDDGEEQPTETVVILDGKGDIAVTQHGVWVRTIDSYGWVPLMRSIPTRGQFRALCRGLGVEVPG
jgi:hypothetical protein